MYAVYQGKTSGIFPSWDLAKEQVEGVSGARCKRFDKVEEAEKYVKTGLSEMNELLLKKRPTIFSSSIIKRSITAEPEPVPVRVQVQVNEQEIVPVQVIRKTDMFSESIDMVKTVAAGVANARKIVDNGFIPSIYTDGSSVGNGKRMAKAGYGVYFGALNMPNISRKVPPKFKQTNNVAELLAIHDGIKELVRAKVSRVQIYSDSEYAMGVITGKKNASANLEIIKSIQDLITESGIQIIWRHIRAHTGATDIHSIGNSIADRLAVEGANKGS
jgi:ribonuclease HI